MTEDEIGELWRRPENYMQPLKFAASLLAADRARRPKFAGWFTELQSGMAYRLWEQGEHDPEPGYVALYEA